MSKYAYNSKKHTGRDCFRALPVCFLRRFSGENSVETKILAFWFQIGYNIVTKDFLEETTQPKE